MSADEPLGCGINERRVLCSPDESLVDRVGGLIVVEIIKQRSAARAKNSLRDTPRRFAASSTRAKVSSGSEMAVFMSQV